MIIKRIEAENFMQYPEFLLDSIPEKGVVQVRGVVGEVFVFLG